MWSKLARIGLAGFVVVGGGGLTARAAASEDPPPPKKRAPSFTDDDLARYREERIRNEAAPPEASPLPPPGQPSIPAIPSRPPAPSAAPALVEILDLNRTLPRDARAAAEAAGRRFAAFFGLPVTTPLVIPLRYFPDASSYRDHLDRNVDPQMRWTGYYDPLKGEIVVGNSPEFLEVLIHEVNHFVFDAVFDEAPVWLREGLAEYFETASATVEGLAVADQPGHRRELGDWLKGGRRPDLRQLLALNTSMWRDHEVAGSRRVRALSWSVVAFLMSSPGGRATLHEFLAALKDQRGLHSLLALDRTFPGGANAFERQWLAHIQQRAIATV